MYDAYYNELWTATILMIYRILERVLRAHVEYDLKQDEVKSLGESIKILQEKNYDEDAFQD